MRLLVLGGTRFLGRHVVDAALARGHEVATFTRGLSGRPAVGATDLRGDRDDPPSLAAALETGLVQRGVEQSVADTWAWWCDSGGLDAPRGLPATGLPAPGLPVELEQRLLAGAR